MIDHDAAVPAELRHRRFLATPLTAEVAELDYASYMASPDVIRIHSDGRWPVEGFSLTEDLELVAEHQADHEHHRAFAFVLLSPSRAEALGCLYLNPLREYLTHVSAPRDLVATVPSASAMVTFWLRQDQQATNLAEDVVREVNDWLMRDWPLSMHLFRVLPREWSSCDALERVGLSEVAMSLPGETRPYRWYAP